jgi:hypothetical protein
MSLAIAAKRKSRSIMPASNVSPRRGENNYMTAPPLYEENTISEKT